MLIIELCAVLTDMIMVEINTFLETVAIENTGCQEKVATNFLKDLRILKPITTTGCKKTLHPMRGYAPQRNANNFIDSLSVMQR